MNLFWFKRIIPDPKFLKRVLIISPFGLGDALFITPLIRSLKESGVEQIDLLLGSRTRELFEHNPHVNQIFEWSKYPILDTSQKWNYLKQLGTLLFQLWQNRYQAMFDFTPKAKYALLSWLILWIPVRIGFSFEGRGVSLTHKFKLLDGYTKKSVVEYYLDLLNFLGIQPTAKQLELFLKEEDFRDCGAILNNHGLDCDQSYLVVVPGGGESWGRDARLKRWPVEYFGKLIRSLHQSYSSTFEKVLILGGQNEHFLGTALLQELGGVPAHNLCGSISIRVAAALIQKASFLLANDGGLVHIAHAVGTPVVALYGPVDPVVYGPYPTGSRALTIASIGPACRPCYQRFRYQASCTGVECLTRLTPDQVLDQIRSARFLEQLSTAHASR